MVWLPESARRSAAESKGRQVERLFPCATGTLPLLARVFSLVVSEEADPEPELLQQVLLNLAEALGDDFMNYLIGSLIVLTTSLLVESQKLGSAIQVRIAKTYV